MGLRRTPSFVFQARHSPRRRTSPARHHVCLRDGRPQAHPKDESQPAAHREGRLMQTARPATPDQAALLSELVARRLLIETGVPGLYGRGGGFEEVRECVGSLVTRAGTLERAEQLRFPPILPRRDLETAGYLKSFPHLAGSIFAFEGDEAQAAEQCERASRHE